MSEDLKPAGQGRIRFEVRLPAGNRTFAADLDLPAEMTQPADLAPVLRQLASALTTFQLAGLSKPVSCRAGCSACCKQMVPVNEPEMHALVELIDGLETGHRERVLARFDQLRIRLDSAGLTEKLRKPPTDPITYQGLMQDYFALGVDCPFLEGGACSIYLDRPSICRQYNVTSPADLCERSFSNDITMVPMPAFVDNLCKIAFAELHNIVMKVTPLPLAREWVDQNPHHLSPVPTLPLFQHIINQLKQALATSKSLS